jgi:hypothetical protein
MLPPARAAVVYVSPSAPGPAHDGTTWATAYTDVTPAVAAAQSGDELWVKRGSYTTQNLMMKPGVALYGGFAGTETARSARSSNAEVTILTGGKADAPVLTIPATADSGTILDGFTVTGGTKGGIEIQGGSPILRNNIITDNHNHTFVFHGQDLGKGGGVLVLDGSPLLEGNNITTNEAAEAGGGVYVTGGSPVIRNNRFDSTAGNVDSYTGTDSAGAGAAIFASDASIEIDNNDINGRAYGGTIIDLRNTQASIRNNRLVEISGDTESLISLREGTASVVFNTMSRSNGACISSYGSHLTAVNNIITQSAAGIIADSATEAVLRSNDVWGNGDYDPSGHLVTARNYQGLPDPTGTNGNISADPQFVSDDVAYYITYRLQPTSPCVDTGDDSVVTVGETDLDGSPRLQGQHVDMGAYEFVPPPPTTADAAAALRIAAGMAPWDADRDFTGDGSVDIRDVVGIVRSAVGTNP